MSSDPARGGDIRHEGEVRRERPRLLSSNNLSGISVFGRSGEKIGTIHSFMIDRLNGRVALAVMSLGGFLGMGGSYHPLPWPLLRHDDSRDGFVIDVDDAVLKGGPTFKGGAEPDFDDTYIDRVWNYYGVR